MCIDEGRNRKVFCNVVMYWVGVGVGLVLFRFGPGSVSRCAIRWSVCVRDVTVVLWDDIVQLFSIL